MSKPDPQIYMLTCEKLQLNPNEIIFVDDAKVIIDAANACGLHGIQFIDNQQTISEIEALITA